jgi:hypothetical protein
MRNLKGVGACRFQKSIDGLISPALYAKQRFARQRDDRLSYMRISDIASGSDGDRAIHGKASQKGRNPPQDGLLLRGKPFVTPV